MNKQLLLFSLINKSLFDKFKVLNDSRVCIFKFMTVYFLGPKKKGGACIREGAYIRGNTVHFSF